MDTSDGWEKLGLYEFFRAKQRARRMKEEGRGGSRSPSPPRRRFNSEERVPRRRFVKISDEICLFKLKRGCIFLCYDSNAYKSCIVTWSVKKNTSHLKIHVFKHVPCMSIRC